MLSLRSSIAISAFFHFFIFIAFFVLPGFGGARVIYKPQYQVTLVGPEDLPALQKSDGPKEEAKPAPAPPPAPKPEVVIPEKKPEVVTKPKEEEKKPEPKPAEEAAKAKADAKQAEEALDDVLNRIKKKVGKSEQMMASKGGSSGGGGGWGERQREIQYQSYHDQVYRVVRGNWNDPPNFDRNSKDVMTVVSISILPDGTITNSFIEQSSGDPLFDQSVMRAILKSNPLPPPPIGVEQQSYDLGLRFFP